MLHFKGIACFPVRPYSHLLEKLVIMPPKNQRKERVKEYFNRSAVANPETFFAGGVTIKAKENEHRIVSDMLGNASHGQRALDAGCGVGGYIDILLQKDYPIIGIDIAPNMLKVCQSKYPGVELALVELEQIPFKEQSFDVILCIDTLQYFSRKSRRLAVENLIKLLKPGGTIILDVKNKYCPFFLFKRFRDYLAEFYSIASITNILKEGGCGNIQTKGVLFPTFASPIVVVKANKWAFALKNKKLPGGEWC